MSLNSTNIIQLPHPKFGLHVKRNGVAATTSKEQQQQQQPTASLTRRLTAKLNSIDTAPPSAPRHISRTGSCSVMGPSLQVPSHSRKLDNEDCNGEIDLSIDGPSTAQHQLLQYQQLPFKGQNNNIISHRLSKHLSIGTNSNNISFFNSLTIDQSHRIQALAKQHLQKPTNFTKDTNIVHNNSAGLAKTSSRRIQPYNGRDMFEEEIPSLPMSDDYLDEFDDNDNIDQDSNQADIQGPAFYFDGKETSDRQAQTIDLDTIIEVKHRDMNGCDLHQYSHLNLKEVSSSNKIKTPATNITITSNNDDSDDYDALCETTDWIQESCDDSDTDTDDIVPKKRIAPHSTKNTLPFFNMSTIVHTDHGEAINHKKLQYHNELKKLDDDSQGSKKVVLDLNQIFFPYVDYQDDFNWDQNDLNGNQDDSMYEIYMEGLIKHYTDSHSNAGCNDDDSDCCFDHDTKRNQSLPMIKQGNRPFFPMSANPCNNIPSDDTNGLHILNSQHMLSDNDEFALFRTTNKINDHTHENSQQCAITGSNIFSQDSFLTAKGTYSNSTGSQKYSQSTLYFSPVQRNLSSFQNQNDGASSPKITATRSLNCGLPDSSQITPTKGQSQNDTHKKNLFNDSVLRKMPQSEFERRNSERWEWSIEPWCPNNSCDTNNNIDDDEIINPGHDHLTLEQQGTDCDATTDDAFVYSTKMANHDVKPRIPIDLRRTLSRNTKSPKGRTNNRLIEINPTTKAPHCVSNSITYRHLGTIDLTVSPSIDSNKRDRDRNYILQHVQKTSPSLSDGSQHEFRTIGSKLILSAKELPKKNDLIRKLKDISKPIINEDSQMIGTAVLEQVPKNTRKRRQRKGQKAAEDAKDDNEQKDGCSEEDDNEDKEAKRISFEQFSALFPKILSAKLFPHKKGSPRHHWRYRLKEPVVFHKVARQHLKTGFALALARAQATRKMSPTTTVIDSSRQETVTVSSDEPQRTKPTRRRQVEKLDLGSEPR